MNCCRKSYGSMTESFGERNCRQGEFNGSWGKKRRLKLERTRRGKCFLPSKGKFESFNGILI